MREVSSSLPHSTGMGSFLFTINQKCADHLLVLNKPDKMHVSRSASGAGKARPCCSRMSGDAMK